ncbi:MAG TPA: hypothetical protein VM266_04215 [Solirubrobacteraceae bacterium]|nr:hypothetical protein [Solirubrobacteraceae bacterium]
MGARGAAFVGALAGAAAGGLLLVLTQPTAAYTNDAYRSGASFGFVVRYALLGTLAALLVHALRRPGGKLLPALGLAVVLGLAIVPPALDRDSASERRRAAATAVDDPQARRDADMRAGAIDGCVRSTQRELERTPDAPDLDPDAYCTCFIDAVIAGPEDDEAQLRAMSEAIRSGRPPRRLTRLAERCSEQAQPDG